MFKSTRMMLFVASLLPMTIAYADETSSRDWSRELSTSAPDTLLVPTSVLPADSPSAYSSFGKLAFQDSSAVGRASKIRSLSLLTLAEFKRSRLFLGVNNRGVLGLHYRAFKQGDDRCLEVARLPYLRNKMAE